MTDAQAEDLALRHKPGPGDRLVSASIHATTRRPRVAANRTARQDVNENMSDRERVVRPRFKQGE